jgi:hypothetical protein
LDPGFPVLDLVPLAFYYFLENADHITFTYACYIAFLGKAVRTIKIVLGFVELLSSLSGTIVHVDSPKTLVNIRII